MLASRPVWPLALMLWDVKSRNLYDMTVLRPPVATATVGANATATATDIGTEAEAVR